MTAMDYRKKAYAQTIIAYATQGASSGDMRGVCESKILRRSRFCAHWTTAGHRLGPVPGAFQQRGKAEGGVRPAHSGISARDPLQLAGLRSRVARAAAPISIQYFTANTGQGLFLNTFSVTEPKTPRVKPLRP
jgi:hypothetical protein